MSATEPAGRVNGTLVVFCLALVLVGMSAVFLRSFAFGAVVSVGVGVVLTVALRERRN